MDWGSLTGGPSGILRGFQGDGSRMNRNLRAALASLLKTTFLLSFLAFSLKLTTSLQIFRKLNSKANSTFLDQMLYKLVGPGFTKLVFHLEKL